MKKIGITTTVPVEVLMAAGYQPVDLNNVLVSDTNPEHLVSLAERDGLPLNCCSWIKGIYGVCMEHGIEDVITVTGGDCSNTIMLMEVLKIKGVNAIPFAYPDHPDTALMEASLRSLAATLGTTLEAAEKVREELRPAREQALKLDELTWKENSFGGWENHLWLISASDFNQDLHKYERDIAELLKSPRQPYPADFLRLAYIGVPSVYARDLHRHLERHGARVVFNEVQRQFAMPGGGATLAEQYTAYTYPYSIRERLRDIEAEIQRRQVDGIIHYVQAFCHRGIGDIVFRDALDLPMLTLEGNDEFSISSHVRTRLEAFLDMIIRGRRRTNPAGSRSKQANLPSGG
jgi:benzoyl-CoA reductase/2-hydroxyglutaryl-CoA dehydratase subunit BcrC/BadD/HgdB